MARKPLLPKYKGASYEIGARAINQRPEFLAAIGRCLTMWPYVEHQMAVILGVFLNAESPATTAVFTTIRMGRTQRDALNAAGQYVLNQKMMALFEAILEIIKTTEKMRSDIAHGQWGILRDHPDVVTWISSSHHATDNARALNGAWPREGHTYLLENTFVYDLSDIEEVYEQIEFT